MQKIICGIKININADDLDQLYDDLKSVFNDDWANIIIQYRIKGPAESVSLETALQSGVVVPASQAPFEIPEDAESDPEKKFTSVFDLIDVIFDSGEVDDDGNAIFIQSPLQSTMGGEAAFVIALQSLTVYEGLSVPGRINVRQAPRVILEGLPVFSEDPELLDEVIANREVDLDDPSFLDKGRKFETYLFTEQFISADQMKQLMPFICSGGDVYRAEIVGYFGDGRGTSRAEVVFDNTIPTRVPKVLMWRDKSHLQTGYSIEALGSELEAIGEQLER